MAGMFYSLEEAAEKLNQTEEELKQIVKEGKLREFRDGPNLLFKVEEVEALMSDIGVTKPEEVPELEPEVPPTETPPLESPEPEIPDFEVPESEAPTPPVEDVDLDEILLAPETGTPDISNDLTDADTALTGQGTSVLGQTDRDYEITDDTMADTVIPPGTSSEVPLEEIEEDVNLDSFGSGSGLLDLSLQADDTSLGGILDEIYTAEGEGQEAGEAEADSAVALSAEADQMIPEEELAVPQPTQEVSALAAPFMEREPDKQSNILGMMLFLPLAVVVYTTVVAVAGLRSVMPSILANIQGLIWYIMAAFAVLTGIIGSASFMAGGERSTSAKPKKAKKEKKPKKEKVKKEKKAKKGKKPKKPKKAK